MRRLRDRVRAHRLGDSGRDAVEHVRRRLGRHVARAEPRAAGREHDLRRGRQLTNRLGDRGALVGNDAALHLVAFLGEQLREDVSAPVLALAGRDAVRDGQDRSPQETTSFVFSSRRTSSTTISLSIAFAMS